MVLIASGQSSWASTGRTRRSCRLTPPYFATPGLKGAVPLTLPRKPA